MIYIYIIIHTYIYIYIHDIPIRMIFVNSSPNSQRRVQAMGPHCPSGCRLHVEAFDHVLHQANTSDGRKS